MTKRIINNCLILLLLCIVLISSCKKDTFITSNRAQLYTSLNSDTLKFDTVFTSIGSITQSFKIFNANNQKLLLSKVQLMGGNASAFKININGNPLSELDNITIPANDSIYIFVSVNINPSNAALPFIVSDSILINYNGINKYEQLQAYGQNAHFYTNKIIKIDTIWTNDLPFVIMGKLTINSATMLTIQKGCRVYSHANAPFLVNGTLVTNGIKDSTVLFTGDRLDVNYKDLTASWPGIYFYGNSINNVLNFTTIKNANQCIEVDSLSTNTNPKLTMHQCKIDNAFGAGIVCNNTSVNIDNSLITNCGNNIIINSGGMYNFTNCTAAGYSNLNNTHKNAVLQLANYNKEATIANDLSANFMNCIFWGDGGVNDEVVINKMSSTLFNVSLNHCIYKVINQPTNVNAISSIETDPKFDSINTEKNIYNFHTTKAAAPGINAGILTTFLNDLDGNARVVNITDIGCYEKQN